MMMHPKQNKSNAIYSLESTRKIVRMTKITNNEQI